LERLAGTKDVIGIFLSDEEKSFFEIYTCCQCKKKLFFFATDKGPTKLERLFLESLSTLV
jgi:hypothetical protein